MPQVAYFLWIPAVSKISTISQKPTKTPAVQRTNRLRSEPLRSNHFHKTQILNSDTQVIKLSKQKLLRDISHIIITTIFI